MEECRTRIVPWLELSGELETAVEGLRFWSTITDTALISIDPARTADLVTVRAQIPEMLIIPGLKTSPILGPSGFDSVAGWAQVGQAVERLREVTNSRFCLLEHESAIAPYISGERTLNGLLLLRALRELPCNRRYLWYPSAAMSGEVLERYMRIATHVGRRPNVAFVDHASFWAPRFVGTPGTVACVNALLSVAHNQPIPMILCSGEVHWPLERIAEAIVQARSDWVIVYPGVRRWVEAAKYLSVRLPVDLPGTVIPALTFTRRS